MSIMLINIKGIIFTSTQAVDTKTMFTASGVFFTAIRKWGAVKIIFKWKDR